MGTGLSTGERLVSALTHALRFTVAEPLLTSLNLQTSATLSPPSTPFLFWDTHFIPTHSCGFGPMAMTMEHTLKTTSRSSSWPSMPAMLFSRFTALSLIQSTLLTFIRLQELLMTGISRLESGSPSQQSSVTPVTLDSSCPRIRSFQAGRRCGLDLKSSLIGFSRLLLRKRQRIIFKKLFLLKIKSFLANVN